MSIYLEDAPGVYLEYFSNSYWTAPVAATGAEYNIDKNWGSGAIFNSLTDCVSIIYHTKLRAPATASFKFYLKHDDGSILHFDGVEKMNM